MTNQEILVKGKITTCRVVGSDGKVYEGISKCNETDKFDYNVGAELAIDRANINRADGEKIVLRKEVNSLKEIIAELEAEIADKENKIKKLNLEVSSRVKRIQDYLEIVE